MFYINKKLKKFSAAHRLIKGYEGKCKNLHGHNYAVDVFIAADDLDHFGFVMDFDDIKLHFDQWIQQHWDHATLVSEIDVPLLDFLKKEKQHHYVLPGEKNTSSERLAEYLFHRFTDILNNLQKENPRLSLTEVRVYESDTAMAGFHNTDRSYTLAT